MRRSAPSGQRSPARPVFQSVSDRSGVRFAVKLVIWNQAGCRINKYASHMWKTDLARSHSLNPGPGGSMRVGRSGLASYVFPILRPGHARAVTMNSETLILECPSRSMVIPVREVETAEVALGWFWGGLQVRFGSGNVTVSGLSKADARVFGDALRGARVDWWRGALDTHAGTIQSVYERLAQFTDPPRYVARTVFSPIEQDAKDLVARFPIRWPEQLSGIAEIRMLKAIQDFSDDSEGFRARACETFVAKELVRSRDFFERIEARPLTDEQRRAVVVDDDRNPGRRSRRKRQDVSHRCQGGLAHSEGGTGVHRNCFCLHSPKTPRKK